MAGLVKQKEYDWKDSNLALFGSDLDHQTKKASALQEPAWKPALACKDKSLFVWRIEKFKVKAWPKDQYGQFFNGDSYIVLNVYKKEDELRYDVHFWIGKHSSQDEYGTAAYKTVELDNALDDKPVQHREVERHESELFLSYFPKMTVLEGGCESGFKHVKPEEYKPRLLHFHGDRKGVRVQEVPLSSKMLDSSDVFILDLGLQLYQWNGSGSNKDERFKAVQYMQELRDERNGHAKHEVLDEASSSKDHEFYNLVKEVEVDQRDLDSKGRAAVNNSFVKKLFRLSDESGKLTFAEVANGNDVKRSQLTEKDVFILDTGKSVFVYTGNEASTAERANAIIYAHNYLSNSEHPFLSVTAVKHGQKCAEFEAAF